MPDTLRSDGHYNKAFFTEVTDHFSGKPYTYPPTPYPSEHAAKQSAQDLVSRRKFLEVKVIGMHGNAIETYHSEQMEKELNPRGHERAIYETDGNRFGG